MTLPVESTVKLLLTLKLPIEESVPCVIVSPLSADMENFSVPILFLILKSALFKDRYP